MTSNAIISNLRKQYDQALKYVVNAKIGNESWNSHHHCFGFNSVDEKATLKCEKLDFPLRDKLPPILSCMYDLIGDKKREFIINAWAFHSVEQIDKSAELLKAAGQITLIDIATKYRGMGWRCNIFFDINTQRFLMLYAGGANGYEQRDNDKIILEYKSDMQNPNDKTFLLDEIMTFINTDDMYNDLNNDSIYSR